LSSYAASVKLSNEAREVIAEAIRRRTSLLGAEISLGLALNRIKLNLADALAQFNMAAAKYLGADVSGDYCNFNPAFEALDAALTDIRQYGYFTVEGRYDFGNDEIEVGLDLESTEYSRLAECKNFRLNWFDPKSDQVTLSSSLRRLDAEDHDPEAHVYVTIDFPDVNKTPPSVVVRPWLA
jgi:hypothetical protein